MMCEVDPDGIHLFPVLVLSPRENRRRVQSLAPVRGNQPRPASEGTFDQFLDPNPTDPGMVTRPFSARLKFEAGADVTGLIANQKLLNSRHGSGAWSHDPVTRERRNEAKCARISCVAKALGGMTNALPMVQVTMR